MANESLEDIVQYLEDVQEIETLLARRSHLHIMGKAMQKEEKKLWAQKTPGAISIANQMGSPQLLNMEEEWQNRISSGAGVIGVYPVTTPVIEVAGDGKTAKAVLISPAAGTSKNKDGEFIARGIG